MSIAGKALGRDVSGLRSSHMAKLLDQQGAIRLLHREGWTQTRGGKHVVKMVKDGQRPITLPRHHGEAYGKGLSADILKQAGLNSTKDTTCVSRSSSMRTGRSTGLRSASSRDASPQAER
jgi:predicted RNA binding protein YcfA (HicA-like mRNA interferase family)